MSVVSRILAEKSDAEKSTESKVEESTKSTGEKYQPADKKLMPKQHVRRDSQS